MNNTQKPAGQVLGAAICSARHVILFHGRFAPMVRSGEKCQTFRTRKRVPRPGEILDLREWAGKPYRSKQIKIREEICTEVERVEFTEDCWLIESDAFLDPFEEDAFAVADGFNGRVELWAWIKETHGLPVVGHLIRWEPNDLRQQSLPADGSTSIQSVAG